MNIPWYRLRWLLFAALVFFGATADVAVWCKFLFALAAVSAWLISFLVRRHRRSVRG
jgi:hypothetical protein